MTRQGEAIEHLADLRLDVELMDGEDRLVVKENFQWDMSNPDNSPDELAAQLIADLMLDVTDKDIADRKHRAFSCKLAVEIRRAIQLYQVRTCRLFKSNCEMILANH